MYYCHNSANGLHVMWCAFNEPRWSAAGVQYPAGLIYFCLSCHMYNSCGVQQFPTPRCVGGKVAGA